MEVVLIPLILIGFILWKGIIILRPNEAAALESNGKYTQLLFPGFHWWMPGYQRLHEVNWKFSCQGQGNSLTTLTGPRIPLHQLRYDPEPLQCRTKEGVEVMIDLVISWKIVDAKKAVYETTNLFAELEDTVLSKLDTIARRYSVNELRPELLTEALDIEKLNTSLLWLGCVLIKINVQDIELPESLSKKAREMAVEQVASRAQLTKLENEKQQYAQMAELRQREQQIKNEIELKAQEHSAKLAIVQSEQEVALQRLHADAQQYVAKITLEQERAKQAQALQTATQEAALFASHPEYARYATEKLAAQSWAKISRSKNTKLVVAPLSALDAAARMPLLQALNK